MAIPVIGAVASRIGLGVASGGAFAAGSKLLKNGIPNIQKGIRNILGNSTGRNAAFAIGGFSSAELFDALGIQNKQFQQLTLVALGIGLLVAIGQVFNIDLNL